MNHSPDDAARITLVAMEQARDAKSFSRDPVGRWFNTRTTLAWCVSPTLSGVAAWGRGSLDDAKDNVQLYEALFTMREPTDLVMDGRGFEALELEGVAYFLDWARERMEGLQRHVRRRRGLIPRGEAGLVLAGFSPVLGWLTDVSIAPDLDTALRELDAPDPEALGVELEGIVRSLRATPAIVIELRSLLRAHDGKLSLAEAARALGASARSLQRALAAEGRSFRAEEQDARFEVAVRMLAQSDDKVSAIARRLGVTEGALAQLIRSRTGDVPSAYRERMRAKTR